MIQKKEVRIDTRQSYLAYQITYNNRYQHRFPQSSLKEGEHFQDEEITGAEKILLKWIAKWKKYILGKVLLLNGYVWL